MTAGDPRVQRARKAVTHWAGEPKWHDLVRDLLAVVDEQQPELDRLQRWKGEAIPVMLGLQDLGRALDIPLGTRITGEVAAKKAAALVAERDRLLIEMDDQRARTRHAEIERDEMRGRMVSRWIEDA